MKCESCQREVATQTERESMNLQIKQYQEMYESANKHLGQLRAEIALLKEDLRKQIDKNNGKPPLRDGISPETWAKTYDENVHLKAELRTAVKLAEHYRVAEWKALSRKDG